MGVLTEMKWPKTTLLDLLNDAELLDVDQFDVVHLELNSGRDYLVAVITGEKAANAAELLERLRSRTCDMADTIAFCWASGLIQFGDQVPEGAIEIARGDDQVVREILVTNSRHAYDNVSLLVPGVPEAANQTEGGDALECFIRLLAKYDSAAFQVAYVEDV